MTFEAWLKRILALLFLLFLCVMLIRSGPVLRAESISRHLMDGSETMDGIESSFASTLWNKRFWIDLNGVMARSLGMRGYYSGMDMYITEDRRIVSSYEETSTDYEVQEITALKTFLDEQGIDLLYVNAPVKYTDDDWFTEEFGIETYGNRNADLFLSRITDAGIAALDLREALTADGMDIADMFYRTDHHWTVPTGLWAASKIAEELDRRFDSGIDLSLYDPDRYIYTHWTDCWLGEQGKKISALYVGLDDYTEVKPAFDTDFTLGPWFILSGTFDQLFVNESTFSPDADVYEADSWHYAYNQIPARNNLVNHGSILLISDSYSQVMEPFLALGVQNIDVLILRQQDDTFSLQHYISENEFDTVVICYAQFMIGAHDYPSSANYRMFTFE